MICAKWGAVTTILLSSALPLPAGQQRFRQNVVLVPIDVHVVDRNGDPVADLGPEEFRIWEDGQPQEIALFEARNRENVRRLQSLAQDDVPRDVAVREASAERRFLLLFGRGRLDGPANGLAAARQFVAQDLKGGDQVALMAFNRITELTTDLEAVVSFIDRYAMLHEEIEALLDHADDDSLQSMFRRPGSRRITAAATPELFARIEEFFADSSMPRSKPAVASALPWSTIEARERGSRDALSATNYLKPGPDVGQSRATWDDIEQLYAAIEYLRLVDGEKHLIYFTEEGLAALGSPDHADSFAAIAADARITVSPVHTTGVQARFTSGPRPVYRGPTWLQRWAVQDSRAIAEATGGVSSIYQWASEGLAEIDATTAVRYLLAYYPSNDRWTGTFRRIRVQVLRDGVRLRYRSGYFGVGAAPPDRQQVMTRARILSALATPRQLGGMSADARLVAGHVELRVRLSTAWMTFHPQGLERVAQLELAVTSADGDDRTTSYVARTIDLRISESEFAALAGKDVEATVRVPLEAIGDTPTRLRVVAYNYVDDVLASATAQVAR